jgi:hypothetical protein
LTVCSGLFEKAMSTRRAGSLPCLSVLQAKAQHERYDAAIKGGYGRAIGALACGACAGASAGIRIGEGAPIPTPGDTGKRHWRLRGLKTEWGRHEGGPCPVTPR